LAREQKRNGWLKDPTGAWEIIVDSRANSWHQKKKREMCVTAVFVASSGHGGIWRGSDIYNNLIGLLSFHKIRTRPSRNQLSQLTPRERDRERETWRSILILCVWLLSLSTWYWEH
jgi:hypothetical protein